MTKFFKNLKRPKKVAPAVPRSLDEIGKEYSKLISDVGQAQYQVYVYTQEVERLNKILKEVNLEAKARNELDQAAKDAANTKAIDASVANINALTKAASNE